MGGSSAVPSNFRRPEAVGPERPALAMLGQTLQPTLDSRSVYTELHLICQVWAKESAGHFAKFQASRPQSTENDPTLCPFVPGGSQTSIR